MKTWKLKQLICVRIQYSKKHVEHGHIMWFFSQVIYSISKDKTWITKTSDWDNDEKNKQFLSKKISRFFFGNVINNSFHIRQSKEAFHNNAGNFSFCSAARGRALALWWLWLALVCFISLSLCKGADTNGWDACCKWQLQLRYSTSTTCIDRNTIKEVSCLAREGMTACFRGEDCKGATWIPKEQGTLSARLSVLNRSVVRYTHNITFHRLLLTGVHSKNDLVHRS